MKKKNEHFIYRKEPVYLLCAGAYVASDFDLIHCYPKKMLKWGYFPEVNGVYGEDFKTEETISDKVSICWAGRLIDLKHPEFAVKLADTLKNKGIDFELTIIGDGRLSGTLAEKVRRLGLESYVTFTGGLKPSAVTQYMKKADIFLFTSNYLEGWGAVVNEAMQCGCAVVASAEAGCVPFLIENGVNGLSYKNGSYKDFEQQVLYLLSDKDKIREFGKRAYNTTDTLWNAENAAWQFVKFCREYLDSGKEAFPAAGPMSRAGIIRPSGFMRTLREKNVLE
jgi:glycosyltransferase involved in cell wall biosynthesis